MTAPLDKQINRNAVDHLRTRLMDTALNQFAALGYDGASTRGIASAAGTAMSALTYHFGSKFNLHQAVAEIVATRLAERTRQARRSAMNAPSTRLAIAGWKEVMITLLDLLLDPKEEVLARFILRGRMLRLQDASDPVSRELDKVVDELAACTDGLRPGGNKPSELLPLAVLSNVLSALFVVEHWCRRSGRRVPAADLELLKARIGSSLDLSLTALFVWHPRR